MDKIVAVWEDGWLLLPDRPTHKFIAALRPGYVLRMSFICKYCGELSIPEYGEPFSSCQCCTCEHYL